MTYNSANVRKATTAIAAVLALSSTPLLAQETSAPADPLAPAAETSETAVPPAPTPKVETTTTTRTERATRTAATRPPPRSTIRRTATAPTAAPAATAPTPPAETAAPVPPVAEPLPPAAAPIAAPAAEPAPAPVTAETLTADITSEENLPIAGAVALGLLALGGTGLVAMRRKRRREEEEFEARQQALERLGEEEPALELGPAQAIPPQPAFARARAPMHDPVPASRTPAPAGNVTSTIPAQGNWESRPDADFMFRRAGEQARTPADQD